MSKKNVTVLYLQTGQQIGVFDADAKETLRRIEKFLEDCDKDEAVKEGKKHRWLDFAGMENKTTLLRDEQVRLIHMIDEKILDETPAVPQGPPPIALARPLDPFMRGA